MPNQRKFRKASQLDDDIECQGLRLVGIPADFEQGVKTRKRQKAVGTCRMASTSLENYSYRSLAADRANSCCVKLRRRPLVF